MTHKLFVACALLLTATACGCQSVPKQGDLENADVRGNMDTFCPETWNNGGYYTSGSSNCNKISCRHYCPTESSGLCGVAGGICKESWALVNVIFAKRWEGGYPNGALNGWKGSWCGKCGSGSIDNTEVDGYPPGSGGVQY